MNENEKLRQDLLKAAHNLYMRVGIKSVSMDDIAREMGVSKKTIYQVVDNKEQLIDMVMQQDACEDREVLARNRSDSKDAIDEFLRNSRFFIRQMRQISPTTFRDLQKYYPSIWKEQMETHHAEFQQSIADNLDRGMEEGLYRDDIESDIVSTLYSGMIKMVIDRAHFPAQDRLISDIISQLTRYHFHGITNQFGRERLESYLKQEALE